MPTFFSQIYNTLIMNIIPLKDNPDWIDAVVEQQWREWEFDDADELREFFAQEFGQTSPNAMPRTWMMVDGETLVGAITLSLNELGKRQPADRNPWLGYLYVSPDYRGQGVAKALTNHAVTMGKALGYPNVYLYASDEKPRYLRWGWQPLETLKFEGEKVTVMVCPQ